MSIIVTKGGKKAHRLEPTGIPLETHLQDYVQANPEVLPMDSIREDLRLLVVAREYPTASGAIDVIAVDQEGEIYLIETKLFKNPDKRQVVAQVLDYGAALWSGGNGPGDFINDLQQATIKLLGQPLSQALQEHFGLEGGQADELIQNLDANVRDGSFRFVVLMDRMEDRLKDLVSFVNENSRFTVYGVELEFYRFEDYEIVIPRLYGAEARKEVKAGSQRRTWDEQSFFEDCTAKLEPTQIDAVKRLYEYSVKNADQVSWGTGRTMGSFNPKFERIARPSLITVYSDGRMSLNFGGLRGTDHGRNVARWLAESVTRDLGVELPKDYEIVYPHLRPEQWMPKVDALIHVIDDVVSRAVEEGR